MFQRLGLGGPRQRHGVFVSSIGNKDLGSLVYQPKRRGPRRTPRAEQGNARSLQLQPFFQGSDHARNIGVKTIELAVCARSQSVARPDFRRQRVHVCQVRQHLLFQRHGYGYAAHRQFHHQGEQIGQRAHLERQQHCVHVLAPERSVVQQWRERMADRVSGHAKYPRRRVKLFQPIEIAQAPQRHLAGRGLYPIVQRSKGERRPGARSEHAAHQSFLAHRDAHHARRPRSVFDQPQHRQVVGQRMRRRNHLYKIRFERANPGGSLLQSACPRKIVKTHQKRRARCAQPLAKPGQLGRPGFFRRLNFQIDDLAAGLRSFQQHVKLSGERAAKVPMILLAAACGNGRHVTMPGHKSLEFCQNGCRSSQRIQPELQEFRVFQRHFGPFQHLCRRACLDRHAQLSQLEPGANNSRRRCELYRLRHPSQLRILRWVCRLMQQP